MGRRKKAAKKAVKKKRPTVAKIFKCIFCHHDKSVTCKLDMDSKTGNLQCSVCNAKYRTQVHDLTEPIDIFTEWLDEANEAQKKVAEEFGKGRSRDPHENARRLLEEDHTAHEDEDPGAADDYEEEEDE